MIIKHMLFKDICFEVTKKWDVGHKWVLKGHWINQGFVESFPLGIRGTIKINKSNFNDWLIAEDKNAKCLRYANWGKLG